MAMMYHIQIDLKKVPNDFRDDSLYRAAVRLNQDIPTLFPDDSLEFLRELAITLPRRGVVYLGTADGFLTQLAVDTISDGRSPEAQELLELRRRKWDAVNHSDFQLAADLYARQQEVREQVAARKLQLITKERIVAALARDGVTTDAEALSTWSSSGQ
jgi:hypothetical protein